MSTRSYICIETKPNEYKGVYCHWDGYLDYNGKILVEDYDEREKVEKLIELGDMSSLGRYIEPDATKEHTFDNPQRNVCVFYGRDRGETDTLAKPVNLKDLDRDTWIEYVYIYTLMNEWVYFETGNLNKGLKRVSETLERGEY